MSIEIEDLKKITLEKGEVIVVKSQYHLSEEAKQKLVREIEDAIGRRHKTVVLQPGVSLGVVAVKELHYHD